MDIASIIKAGRTKKKISQEELAKRVGVTKNNVWAWENNKYVPAGDVLIRLALELDIVSDLFPGYSRQAISADITNTVIEKAPSLLESIERRLATLEQKQQQTTIQIENRDLIELLERRLSTLEEAIRNQQAIVNNVNGHNVVGSVNGGHVAQIGDRAKG